MPIFAAIVRRRLAIPVLLLAAVLGSACTIRVGPTPANAATAQERQAASDPVIAQLVPDPALYETEAFEWKDASRDRAVPVRLYFPSHVAPGRSVPLVVFSHGLGGSREGYKYLGRYFAANGYASLHLQHVGSDRQIWGGNMLGLLGRLSDAAQDSEAIARAQDVSFALDQLLAGPYGQRIDATRIVAAGHSYGANTAMLVSGAHVERAGKMLSFRDTRIRAAILLSAPPFYGAGDPGLILGGVDIPTLHITATADDIEIPGYRSGVRDRLDIYRAMGKAQGAQKALAVFKDGSHSIFTDRLNTGGAAWNPQVKLATRELALAFLNRVTQGDAQDAAQGLQRWRERYGSMLSSFESSGASL